MNKFKNISSFLLAMTLLIASCEIEEIQDPNNPSLQSVSNNASIAELQVLVTGLEARHRGYFTNATQMFGTFGREVLPYFGSDPRFQNEWLGLVLEETYPDFFASGGSYIDPYLTVKQANVLIESVENSNSISEQQANGYLGFAKTIKAHQLLFPLMQQYQNGIRVEVSDPLNPGPILSYDDALNEIIILLNEAYDNLQNAGDSFLFDLTAGYSDFADPASFGQVNRALTARVNLYAENYTDALTALDDSFMDFNGDMSLGPAHVYGEAPDVNNPLFYPLDRPTNTILIVHPAMIEDTLAGDGRISKFAERVENPVTNSNIEDSNGDPIPGRYQDARWTTNTAPIPYIRNEELILIYAEAQITNDVNEAVDAINVIRNFWGVGDYTGPTDAESLENEILFQRRYSLWAEGGHRWIDLRRLGKLNDQYVDLRAGGNLFTQVARRTSETNWDNNN